MAAISIEYANNLTAFRYVQNEIDYLKNNVGSQNLTVKSTNELTINNSTGYEAVLQTPDGIYKYVAVRIRDDYLIIYLDNEGGSLMQEQIELAATICSTIKISAAYNPLSTCIFDDYKISDDTLEIFYHLKFLFGRKIWIRVLRL